MTKKKTTITTRTIFVGFKKQCCHLLFVLSFVSLKEDNYNNKNNFCGFQKYSLLSDKLCAVTVFVVRQAHQPCKNMRQRSKNFCFSINIQPLRGWYISSKTNPHIFFLKKKTTITTRTTFVGFKNNVVIHCPCCLFFFLRRQQ